MKKNLPVLIALFIIVVLAVILLVWLPSQKAAAPADSGKPDAFIPAAGIDDLISVSAPRPGEHITSPLFVTGIARGTWFFEASFPAELKDAQGNTIAQGAGQAQGDWMTEDFVPFSLSLTYPAQPAGSRGTLVLHKDNPSGDPSKDQQVSVQVAF